MNRAPFGWTKSFNIKVKGHPLAENARTFQKKGNGKSNTESTAESIALKSEDVLNSTWYVLVPGDNLIPIKEYTFQKIVHSKN